MDTVWQILDTKIDGLAPGQSHEFPDAILWAAIGGNPRMLEARAREFLPDDCRLRKVRGRAAHVVDRAPFDKLSDNLDAEVQRERRKRWYGHS